ncbi:MAG: site-specific integrase [Endozoicomonas sp.]
MCNEAKFLPKENQEDIPDPLEDEEFDKVISACASEFHQHLFTFACYTGLRCGEIAALTWAEVDFASETVLVRRNITRHGFKLTKTYKARTVDSLPPALEALKKMRLLTALLPDTEIEVYQRDKGIRNKEKVRFVFNPLCFWHSGDKAWGTTNSISKRSRLILERAGVRHRRFHQTRHTYACWALAHGGNVAYVAQQLGHKNLKMVIEVYAKWMPSRSRSEAGRIWQSMIDNDSSSIGYEEDKQ